MAKEVGLHNKFVHTILRKCYENNLKNNDELSDKFSAFVEVDIACES